MIIASPSPIFNEILDLLASTPTPEQIIAFQPSEALEQRLAYLLEQNQRDRLSAKERAELDEFLQLNHLMNMLKIRARQKLAKS